MGKGRKEQYTYGQVGLESVQSNGSIPRPWLVGCSNFSFKNHSVLGRGWGWLRVGESLLPLPPGAHIFPRCNRHMCLKQSPFLSPLHPGGGRGVVFCVNRHHPTKPSMRVTSPHFMSCMRRHCHTQGTHLELQRAQGVEHVLPQLPGFHMLFQKFSKCFHSECIMEPLR